MTKPSLFKSRPNYKPFDFPWAFDDFQTSEQMHWMVKEVPLNPDVRDWKTRLTDSEKNLLTHIFRFFTQADCDVASGYIDRYLPVFKPVEIRMAMSSIAAREAIHIWAYSTLIDELGIPEVEYHAFMAYEEMKAKHDYMFSNHGEGIRGLAKDIAIFSAFGEGLQLFSSFVILLNFTRFEMMKGMGQVISWSIRDETHHVDFMMKIWHQLIDEHPEVFDQTLIDEIYDCARTMVELEDNFIDLAFHLGDVRGLSAQEVKQYIRYIADIRLRQLGLSEIYGVDANPLPWVDTIVFGKEHVNFFENRPTDYARGTVQGSWDDAFN